MRQLSALDAQFLNFESVTNTANIAGLAILDASERPGGPLTRDDLIALLDKRSHLAPPLRRRLVQVPLGLDHPYWAEDADPDLDYHVRELALPPPGTERQLAEQIARLHARPLDRSRPLWEMYLIHGLAGGRAALYTKVHHAAVDGITGADALAALLDATPEPREVPPPEEPGPQSPPGVPEMLVRGAAKLLVNPARAVRFLADAVPRLDEIPLVSQVPGAGLVSRGARGLARRFGGGRQVPDLPRMIAPRTPFSGLVSAHRRFAFAALPLEEIKRLKNAFDVTVNDVVMTLCASAVRRWLLSQEALPARPLVAGVPFSLRIDGTDRPGNQVTIMITPLATHIADPVDRLHAIRESMLRIKDRFALAPARWLEELSESMPAALAGLADRAVFGLLGQTAPPINLIVSNVPGPQFPLYVCGARLLAHYPVSVISDMSGGLNITAFSYNGSLDVGIVACRDMVPDAWPIAEHLREALGELSAAGSGTRRDSLS
jgi:diacylglycerol O-acyltransferase